MSVPIDPVGDDLIDPITAPGQQAKAVAGAGGYEKPDRRAVRTQYVSQGQATDKMARPDGGGGVGSDGDAHGVIIPPEGEGPIAVQWAPRRPDRFNEMVIEGRHEKKGRRFMTAIPFIDLKTQYARIEEDVRRRIDAVLASGQFILGPEVRELEKRLAEYVGTKRAVTCASGTDALLMPLMGLGVGPGDAVFTTPFTFIATAEVIALLGATPVFVDIDPATFNIDPPKLEEAVARVRYDGKLTPKAIIPVDLFGLPADYDALTAIAERERLHLIEDACQGFGGNYKGKRAGSFGVAGSTSFFPAKPLGCFGDGGAIFLDDDDLADRMLSIRVHGYDLDDKYENVRVGINGRMDTIQAAVLLAKMDIFDDEFVLRQRVAGWYEEALSGLVKTPHVPEGYESVWAQYTLVTDRRADVMAGLKEEGVPTAVYYPKPLHLQKAFAPLEHMPGDFPISESMAGKVFSVPMSPYVTEEIVERVAAGIKRGLGR